MVIQDLRPCWSKELSLYQGHSLRFGMCKLLARHRASSDEQVEAFTLLAIHYADAQMSLCEDNTRLHSSVLANWLKQPGYLDGCSYVLWRLAVSHLKNHVGQQYGSRSMKIYELTTIRECISVYPTT